MKQKSGAIILGALLAVLLLGSAAAGSAALTSIGPDEAYELIQRRGGDPDFLILDVRTPGEYEAGHIAGSVNIDFYGESFAAELDRLDRDRTYLIYCRSGNRSGRTLGAMKKLGFKDVYNMNGGFMQWQLMSYPVVV